MSYICSCCGEEMQDWPAITYISPISYSVLSDFEKENIATLTSDFCVIEYPDQTDRFIRTVMVQKVDDSEEDLHYGFWVSLSEKSFEEYENDFGKVIGGKEYFGWLCSYIPQYDFLESIPMKVVTRSDGDRPLIFPEQDFDHPFVRDFYIGISRNEAEKRVHDVLRSVAKTNDESSPNSALTKPWWRLW